jgi:hypothetical protein
MRTYQTARRGRGRLRRAPPGPTRTSGRQHHGERATRRADNAAPPGTSTQGPRRRSSAMTSRRGATSWSATWSTGAWPYVRCFMSRSGRSTSRRRTRRPSTASPWEPQKTVTRDPSEPGISSVRWDNRTSSGLTAGRCGLDRCCHLETLEPVKGGSLLAHFSETIATETGGRLRCNHRMSLECLAIRWHKS